MEGAYPGSFYSKELVMAVLHDMIRSDCPPAIQEGYSVCNYL